MTAQIRVSSHLIWAKLWHVIVATARFLYYVNISVQSNLANGSITAAQPSFTIIRIFINASPLAVLNALVRCWLHGTGRNTRGIRHMTPQNFPFPRRWSGAPRLLGSFGSAPNGIFISSVVFAQVTGVPSTKGRIYTLHAGDADQKCLSKWSRWQTYVL